MMSSSLREKLGRLERIQGVVPTSFGSPAAIEIAPPTEPRRVRAIPAITELVRVHVPVGLAKTAIDAAIAGVTARVEAPMIDDAHLVAETLAASGFAARVVMASEPVLAGFAEPRRPVSD